MQMRKYYLYVIILYFYLNNLVKKRQKFINVVSSKEICMAMGYIQIAPSKRSLRNL